MQATGKDYSVYKDMDVQFGGTPGTVYNVTLRFRGVLEGKEYLGGTAQGQGLQFYTGGMPGTTDPWVNYNTVGFTVSVPMQTYYINNAELNVIGDDLVFAMDYTVTIHIAGGAPLHLFSQDSNCTAVPNAACCASPGVTARSAIARSRSSPRCTVARRRHLRAAVATTPKSPLLNHRRSSDESTDIGRLLSSGGGERKRRKTR